MRTEIEAILSTVLAGSKYSVRVNFKKLNIKKNISYFQWHTPETPIYSGSLIFLRLETLWNLTKTIDSLLGGQRGYRLI